MKEEVCFAREFSFIPDRFLDELPGKITHA